MMEDDPPAGEPRMGSLGPLYAACAREAARHPNALKRLQNAGIDRDLQFQIRMKRCGQFFGAARVMHNGAFLFDFAANDESGGAWNLVLPEFWDRSFVDLVAFPLDHPNRVASFTGTAVFLGEEQVERDVFVEGEVMLWDDPLQWLQSGCVGGVPLRFDGPLWAVANTKVIAASPELAQRIARSFATASPVPQLSVRRPKKKGASA